MVHCRKSCGLCPCSDGTCPALPKIENGIVTCMNENKDCSLCVYSCTAMHHTLVGERALRCSASEDGQVGSWDHDPPSCVATCADADEFAASCPGWQWACSDPEWEEWMWERCYKTCGYCSDDLQCPTLQLENGLVECSNGYNLESVCEFSCNDGYWIDGKLGTTCEENELGEVAWRNAGPVCREVTTTVEVTTTEPVTTTTATTTEGTLHSFILSC